MVVYANAVHFLATYANGDCLIVFVMSGLCSILTSPGGGSPSKEDLQLIQILLRWPSQYSFPGMPCVMRFNMYRSCTYATLHVFYHGCIQ